MYKLVQIFIFKNIFKNVIYWGNFNHFRNKLQRFHSKFHLYEKIILGENDM
jgi:hypothetical protein